MNICHSGPPSDRPGLRPAHALIEVLTGVPAAPVWAWVEGNVDKRAWYLANLVPPIFPGDERSPSARELLVRYGDREDVRRNLMANFSSEIWWGPESGHHREKLATLKGWKQGETNPNVIRWLDEYAALVESRVERARIEEERED